MVMVNHVLNLLKDIHEKFGLEAHAPNTGETVTV